MPGSVSAALAPSRAQRTLELAQLPVHQVPRHPSRPARQDRPPVRARTRRASHHIARTSRPRAESNKLHDLPGPGS